MKHYKKCPKYHYFPLNPTKELEAYKKYGTLSPLYSHCDYYHNLYYRTRISDYFKHIKHKGAVKKFSWINLIIAHKNNLVELIYEKRSQHN